MISKYFTQRILPVFPSRNNDKMVLQQSGKESFDGNTYIRNRLHKPTSSRWISERSRFRP